MPGLPTNVPRRFGEWDLLGFRVHVRPGFLLLVALAIVTSPGPLGFWLAAALATLTLAHELGHALAARAFGARAEISLDLLAGYTSYAATRPMTTLERVLVVLAGPVAQVAPAVVALLALGANPFDGSSVTATDARWAIWWAGPVIGLINLLPVLPLDGGMIVATLLDRPTRGHGRRVALVISIGLTVAATVVLVVTPGLRPLALLAAALLAAQLLQLRAELGPAAGSAARDPGYAIVEGLLERGDHRRAAEMGAEMFAGRRSPDVAVLMARVAARADEPATALAWLQAASFAADDPWVVLDELDTHPDLAGIRDTEAGGALRRALTDG